jgi:hypothetical protein
MNDYGARLAWIFSPTKEEDCVWVETYASIPVVHALSELG